MKLVRLLPFLLSPTILSAAPVVYSLNVANYNRLFSFVAPAYILNLNPEYVLDASAFTSCNFYVGSLCYAVALYPESNDAVGFTLAVYTGVANNSNSRGFYIFTGIPLTAANYTYVGYEIGSLVPVTLTAIATPEPRSWTLFIFTGVLLAGHLYLSVRKTPVG